MAGICPTCCARQRDDTCGACQHNVAAQRYNAVRQATPPPPRQKPFIFELNPEVETAVNWALELVQRGKLKQAETAMGSLLAKHPRNHTVLYGMGVLHAMRNDHKAAIAWFDKATDINPYFLEAHFNTAIAYRRLSDVANTARALRTVIEVGDPEDDLTCQAKGLLEELDQMTRKTNGLDLDTYIKAQGLFEQAFTRMTEGAWGEALAGFREAAAWNERHPATHGNMGICLANLGRKAEALRELEFALEIDPEYEPAITNRMLVVTKMEEGTPLNAGFKEVNFARERAECEQNGGRKRRDPKA